MDGYARYRIERKRCPNAVYFPHPFKVKIKRWALFKFLVKELLHYRKKSVVASNPCAYGVFSGPIGGFAPREKLCVGCLRCTTQHPEISTILPNPERARTGDSYVTPEQVGMIIYEAVRGQLAVRGAGYKGVFGGKNWDAIWTDLSEIVRPTRDGIFGREYISTEVHIGARPAFMSFSDQGEPIGAIPRSVSLPLPIMFDTVRHALFSDPKIVSILACAAAELKTFALVPLSLMEQFSSQTPYIIPVISSHDWRTFKGSQCKPLIIEMKGWDPSLFQEIVSTFPDTFIMLRTHFDQNLLPYYEAGVRIFHLMANHEGRGERGKFITQMIREIHQFFVQQKCRDQVTLMGSGGFVAAEHVPKSILLGLDAVALDTPLMIALQCNLEGERAFSLPKKATREWGVQRIKNLMAAWQDQLFEFAGAMGLREIRRMRGDIGRVLFQEDLEKEAFGGIEGYER